MNRITNLLWGILLIVIGVIFGLNVLEIANINVFFDGWWTLFIIVPCFIGLFNDKDKTTNIIGIVIGFCLLLTSRDIIKFEIMWKLLIPITLIVLGLSLIYKSTINNNLKQEVKKMGKHIDKEYYATFSTQNFKFNEEEAACCKLNSIFGSIKCDLTNSILKEDIIITTSSIFGNITLEVPDNVNVKVIPTRIFGSVYNNKKNKSNNSNITIYVDAFCLFGGIEIK